MGFARAILRPASVFLLVAAIVAAIILFIGNTLLMLHPGGEQALHAEYVPPDLTVMREEFLRPDLMAAFLLSLLVLVVCAVLARPRTEPGFLDQPVAIGEKSMFTPVAPPATDLEATQRGPRGTWSDLAPGFTLYAQNGPLAKVVTVLPGESEYGRVRRGLVYATGLFGANEEMWIPVEAIYAVYPETGSAFLAAKGDEIEHFGWNRPPASFRRDAPPHAPISSF
ncbi:MAG: hypothetical protein R2853_03645 [Thermomicrobiales bacterium]|nr:hypothetical protein [Thermomicrobiales bacterium]